jgi:hypothetical protein
VEVADRGIRRHSIQKGIMNSHPEGTVNRIERRVNVLRTLS